MSWLASASFSTACVLQPFVAVPSGLQLGQVCGSVHVSGVTSLGWWHAQVARFLPNPEANWGPKRRAQGLPRSERHGQVRGGMPISTVTACLSSDVTLQLHGLTRVRSTGFCDGGCYVQEHNANGGAKAQKISEDATPAAAEAEQAAGSRAAKAPVPPEDTQPAILPDAASAGAAAGTAEQEPGSSSAAAAEDGISNVGPPALNGAGPHEAAQLAVGNMAEQEPSEQVHREPGVTTQVAEELIEQAAEANGVQKHAQQPTGMET